MPEDRGLSPWERELSGRLDVFVDTWKAFEGTERAAAQPFLQKLLDIYGVEIRPGTVFEQHPVRLPARGVKGGQHSLFGADEPPQFTTERMDMYLPKVCVWETKAPSERDLGKHHGQILGYWARVRTRYMVLCNFHEFWIYDTDDEGGQREPKLRFPLAELPVRGDALLFLRGERPDLAQRSEQVTADVARHLGGLVRELIGRADRPRTDRERVAKLVLQCVFAMFAEDTEMVPARQFTNAAREAVDRGRMEPIWSLFDDFARKDTTAKGNRFAPYVNGPLFDGTPSGIALSDAQIKDLYCAAKDYDWQDVRPEIFGSIFEAALDVVERHEIGAHFTREADIARVVGPTVVEPWRERIAAVRNPKEAEQVVEQMRAFHVLDPACGCGNFLYVVYREMKRLESALAAKWTRVQRAVARRHADIRPPPPRPYFTIHQLHGIELNDFAAFLARVVLWIGEHLANRELGLDEDALPLKSLDRNVRQGDALFLEWPRPDGELAIVGNPPYLGVRKLRHEFGDGYVDRLFARYPDNRAADYVTYWFPRALDVLRPGERAGFVCTNSIAQGESREASIDRIVARGGTITDAWRSYAWPGEAAVHVAVVNWVMAPYDGIKMLDGREVSSVSPSLTDAVDVTAAKPIPANEGICFMGVTPGNREFVLTDAQRAEVLAADPASNAIVRPFLVGRDVNREIDQKPTRWIIDFGTMTKQQAEGFKGAMRHVRKHVYPVQSKNRRESRARNWWKFAEPAPNLRQAIAALDRVLVIPCTSPHLIVSRQESTTCFDHQLMVVALSDSHHFGLLQSRLHGIWARARGSTLKGDLRYTNTTVFETFPFPHPPGSVYNPRRASGAPDARRLAAAADRFERLRSEACRARGIGLTKVHNLLTAGDLPELGAAYAAMNDAAAECYGFPAGVWRDEADTLRRLVEANQRLLHPTRAGAGASVPGAAVTTGTPAPPRHAK